MTEQLTYSKMSGDKGGKNDMERIGLFQEMGYVTIGDKYATPGSSKYFKKFTKLCVHKLVENNDFYIIHFIL